MTIPYAFLDDLLSSLEESRQEQVMGHTLGWSSPLHRNFDIKCTTSLAIISKKGLNLRRYLSCWINRMHLGFGNVSSGLSPWLKRWHGLVLNVLKLPIFLADGRAGTRNFVLFISGLTTKCETAHGYFWCVCFLSTALHSFVFDSLGNERFWVTHTRVVFGFFFSYTVDKVVYLTEVFDTSIFHLTSGDEVVALLLLQFGVNVTAFTSTIMLALILQS